MWRVCVTTELTTKTQTCLSYVIDNFRKRCSNNNKNNNRLSETSTWSASRKQRTTCAVFSFPLVIIINIKKSKAQSLGGGFWLALPEISIAIMPLATWRYCIEDEAIVITFCSAAFVQHILYCTQVHWKRWKRKKEEPFFQRLGRLNLGPSSPPRRCRTKDPDSRSHATIDVLRNIRQQPSMRVCVCVYGRKKNLRLVSDCDWRLLYCCYMPCCDGGLFATRSGSWWIDSSSFSCSCIHSTVKDYPINAE